jgi:hypothetical protein
MMDNVNEVTDKRVKALKDIEEGKVRVAERSLFGFGN